MIHVRVHKWIKISKCIAWRDVDIVTGSMQLIPTEIHDFFRLTGGYIWCEFASKLSCIDDELIQVTTLDG